MKNRALIISLATLSTTGLLLSGCSSSETQATDATTVKVVATTNVYGQIARAVGGDNVEVNEIINSAAQDPHSYEPTARDKLTVSEASIVLANGGGYDYFMDTLVGSLPGAEASNLTFMHAVDYSPVAEEHERAEEEHEEHSEDEHAGHEHAEYNEHIWYDLDSVAELAQALATQLGEQDTEHATDYANNAKTFTAQIDTLRGQLEDAGLAGKSYMMTEPVPFHLFDDAKMVNKTPEGLSEAIEEGEGIAPLTLKKAEDDLSTGAVQLLAYNTQTEGSETKLLARSAEESKTPVVEFTETITDDSSYLDWMESNIAKLASALKG